MNRHLQRVAAATLVAHVLLLAVPSLVHAVEASDQKIATISFEPGGPGVDGYEFATLDVAYRFADCGRVKLLVGALEQENLKVAPYYWFKGRQYTLPGSQKPPRLNSLEFAGKVNHRLQPFKVTIFPDATMASCFTSEVVVGPASDFWGDKATPHEKVFQLNGLSVATAAAGMRHKPLTSSSVESYLRGLEHAAELDAKGKEAEQKAAEAKRKDDAQKTANAKSAGGKGAPATSEFANGDFWGTGAKPPASGTPQTGATQSAIQPAVDQAKQQAEIDRKDAEAAAERTMAAVKARQEQDAQIAGQIEARVGLLSQSFYAAQSADRARSNIDGLTSLDGDYASAEELERDFARRMSSLQAEFATLESSNQQALRARTDLAFSDSDPAIGELANTVGTMVASAQREREEREAREKMEARRLELLAEIEVKRKAMFVEMRRGVLKSFPDGNVPLSSHKIETNVLYFFSYVVDEATVASEAPVIRIGNTFAVHRRGDGTWPFKNGINAEIGKIVSGKSTLMGFYASEALASSMRSSLVKLAKESGFAVSEFHYDRKAPSNAPASVDFWKNGPAKKDPPRDSKDEPIDFWK